MYLPSHDKTAKYRRLAEEARSLARQISITEAGHHLLDTAKPWELLTEEAKRRSQGAGAGAPGEPDVRPPPQNAKEAVRHFFFDTDDGDFHAIDDVGTELADIAAAKAEAQAALADMAKDKLPDGDQRAFVVSVNDETGQTVLRVTLALTVEYPSDVKE